MITLLWQLFATFFVIGIFTFGGGGAMLSLIQAQVVTEHAWMDEEMFTNIVAISQTTPGPIGINCATYTGYEVMRNAGFGNALSILGSASTTFALVLPSFIVFFIIITVFNKVHHNPVYLSTMSVLKPAVAGMIGAAAVLLTVSVSWGSGTPFVRIIAENFPDWKAWVIFILAFAGVYSKKIGPITMIIASGVLGLLIY